MIRNTILNEALCAVGDLMVNMADLSGSLAGIKEGNLITKGKDYVNKLVRVKFLFMY